MRDKDIVTGLKRIGEWVTIEAWKSNLHCINWNMGAKEATLSLSFRDDGSHHGLADS